MTITTRCPVRSVWLRLGNVWRTVHVASFSLVCAPPLGLAVVGGLSFCTFAQPLFPRHPRRRHPESAIVTEAQVPVSQKSPPVPSHSPLCQQALNRARHANFATGKRASLLSFPQPLHTSLSSVDCPILSRRASRYSPFSLRRRISQPRCSSGMSAPCRTTSTQTPHTRAMTCSEYRRYLFSLSPVPWAASPPTSTCSPKSRHVPKPHGTVVHHVSPCLTCFLSTASACTLPYRGARAARLPLPCPRLPSSRARECVPLRRGTRRATCVAARHRQTTMATHRVCVSPWPSPSRVARCCGLDTRSAHEHAAALALAPAHPTVAAAAAAAAGAAAAPAAVAAVPAHRAAAALPVNDSLVDADAAGLAAATCLLLFPAPASPGSVSPSSRHPSHRRSTDHTHRT